MKSVKKGVQYYFSGEGYRKVCLIGGCSGVAIGASVGAKQTFDEGSLPSNDIGNFIFNTAQTMLFISIGAVLGGISGVVLTGTAPLSIPSSLCIAWRVNKTSGGPAPRYTLFR
jgi:hypothetical protein